MAQEHSREERTARLLPEELHLLDLTGTLHRLRSEPEYAANGRNGTTLVKNPAVRVVLEALREGAGMAEHRAPGPITVQVLEGEIQFSVGEAVHTLRAGQLLVLPTRRPHSVKAAQDSAFLLTIAPLGPIGASALSHEGHDAAVTPSGP
jgi:quercetin dioxygenase-like cupin family protein